MAVWLPQTMKIGHSGHTAIGIYPSFQICPHKVCSGISSKSWNTGSRTPHIQSPIETRASPAMTRIELALRVMAPPEKSRSSGCCQCPRKAYVIVFPTRKRHCRRNARQLLDRWQGAARNLRTFQHSEVLRQPGQDPDREQFQHYGTLLYLIATNERNFLDMIQTRDMPDRLEWPLGHHKQ